MTHWNVAQPPSAGSGRSMLRPYKSAGDPHFPRSHPTQLYHLTPAAQCMIIMQTCIVRRERCVRR